MPSFYYVELNLHSIGMCVISVYLQKSYENQPYYTCLCKNLQGIRKREVVG